MTSIYIASATGALLYIFIRQLRQKYFSIETISVEKTLFLKGEKERNFLMVDVRSYEERSEGYIPGSIFLPITELSSRLAELEEHKEDTIIVYCHSGKRSAKGTKILGENGFLNVKNLKGGIVRWKEKGGEIIR